jgi:hypothetical protein
MARKKKLEKPDEPIESQVNEPSMEYVAAPGKNLAEIFKSITVSTFEEQEEDMRKYSLSLTPLQRMAYLYQLNQVAFADVLSNPDTAKKDKEIIIDTGWSFLP